MAIDGLSGYINGVKNDITWMKTGTRTLIAAMPYTVFDLAGNPGAGTLAIGNTANGLVPTKATAGYPQFKDFTGMGYLTLVEFSSSVACRMMLFDRLFAAGAYAFNADVTLTSQPSYSTRIPDSNYNGLQLWIEAVTAFTGILNVNIDYLDQDGNAGNTGTVATLALPVGRCFQLPLAPGDSGIQKIVRVRGTVATAGTFNVMVLRRFWRGRVRGANDGDIHDFLRTGFRRFYSDTALYTILAADSTAVGLPDIAMQVTSG